VGQRGVSDHDRVVVHRAPDRACDWSSLWDDFGRFARTIMFLAMGSIALGDSIKLSGLMDTMDGLFHRMLEGRAL